MNQQGIEFPGRYRTIIKIILLTILLIYPLLVNAETQPESKSVESTGMAVITDNNVPVARDAAVGDALRKAVEQAVGTMVSSETMVENFQLLSDNVYTKTQGYIKSYTVTKEGQSQGFYQVTVKALVEVGTLMDDLNAMGILQKKAEKPRVLFMIAEKNIGHKYYTFWWWGKSEFKGETVDISAAETSLKQIFLNKGFNVVDMSGSTESFVVEDSFKVEDLTKDGAKQIGKKLNAEIVVFGKAMAKEGPRTPESAVGTYLADITLQAVRVDDGGVLASASGHGAARHISEITGGSEAIQKASSELGEKLIEQIVQRWSAGHEITVRLRGVTDYLRVVEFKNLLRGRVRGVQSVYQRRFENGEAIFEIESKVPAQQVADDILKLGLSLRVLSTSPNTITVVMEPVQQ
ncbi:MAG: flagellar assembly protein T N-terminal domain-containing protein [Deltaproteobacteria bacterium]|nr:flagellar assembly protein T N-terminal domain-containing protein [Deltaproteobacteria bacterium]